MDAKKAWLDGSGQFAKGHREVWLLGQPPLQKYLDYIEDISEPGEKPAQKPLIDEWRDANDHYYALEVAEAGLADTIEVKALPASMRSAARKVKADPRYRRAFDLLPTRFAMVELAKLIVPQPHVNLDHTERLAGRLAGAQDDEALFRFCQPLDRSEADVEMRRVGENRFLFWSPSSDFRFHEAAILPAAQLKSYDAIGPVATVLGLAVGFGSNFLNVIESDGRVVLHNGHHRAYTMLAHGLTHAPCIVQRVTRRDELNLVASRAVKNDPAFYFKSARPPLLKDFLDPRLGKVVKIPAMARVVEVSFEIKEYEVKNFGHGH